MCSLSLAESNNMTSLWLHFHTAKQKSQAEWPTKQIISKLMIAFTVNLRNSMSALMAHDIIKLNGMAQHRQPHSIARYAIFCCCCWLRSEKEWCIYQNHFNHGELANWIFCCIPFCQIIRTMVRSTANKPRKRKNYVAATIEFIRCRCHIQKHIHTQRL